MIEKEDGFSTPFAMTIIFALSLSLSGLCFLVVQKQKNVLQYERYYKKEEMAEKLCKEFLEDFQILKNGTVDNNSSDLINKYLLKYADYNVELTDVSTGINTSFLKDEILESKSINNLMEKYGEEVKTEYGWINPVLINEKKLNEVSKDFGDKDLFPIVNGLPLYNVYFMKSDFLENILSFCKTKNKAEKLDEIERLIQYGTLDNEKLKSILAEDVNTPIFSFLGVKTTFWEVVLRNQDFSINLIIGGVPEKNDHKEISKYILINKHIDIKGGPR